jgi:hypothetical protein
VAQHQLDQEARPLSLNQLASPLLLFARHNVRLTTLVNLSSSAWSTTQLIVFCTRFQLPTFLLSQVPTSSSSTRPAHLFRPLFPHVRTLPVQTFTSETCAVQHPLDPAARHHSRNQLGSPPPNCAWRNATLSLLASHSSSVSSMVLMSASYSPSRRLLSPLKAAPTSSPMTRPVLLSQMSPQLPPTPLVLQQGQTQAVPTPLLRATHQPNRSVTLVVAHLPALLETPAQSLPQRTLTAPPLARLNAKLMLLANRKLPFLVCIFEALLTFPSFEFGTLTSGGNPACRLFNVPAASVPAPTSGQTFVVYDVGCSL